MIVRCLDIESTGLDPSLDRIVEIATVDLLMEGDKIERGHMWSSLVNPGREIPPTGSAIHDITDEMVKNAPLIADLYEIIQRGPPDYYCAHNSRFDSRFINLPGAIWLDTYRIALWLWPESPEHKLSTLRYWLKLNLDTAITSSNRSHSAFFDAYVCGAILRRAFLEGATIEDMVKVSNKPALLPRFTFGKWAMRPIAEVDSGYLDWILSQQDMFEDVRHTAFVELQRRRQP